MLPSIFGENLFDAFWNDPFDRRFFGTHDPLYGKHAKNLMKTDIKELKDSYEVAIDLPGFKKDDLNVNLKDGYLTVSAAKSLGKDEHNEEGRYIRQERYAGSCSRSFYVGELKPGEIKAKYESGILHLTFPRTASQLPPTQNRIAIE
ncbi:MAG: Hsp20/alpha crystallin family protein [Oscillospiraceae bacterium]